uniref:Terpene synthase 6 n=1 Tax=Aconitum carmichaelii TaxID=85363 RepID=A0A8E8P1P5_ACOCM|nr:terpene synthase 6 [Aconitum carmichaelii]
MPLYSTKIRPLQCFSPSPSPLPSSKHATLIQTHRVAFTAPRYLCRSSSPANESTVERRSANYEPSVWKHDFVKNLKNDFTGDMYVRRANILKQKTKSLFVLMQDEKGHLLPLLELIDDIQRLGLGYIFEVEIQKAMGFIKQSNIEIEGSLHAAALYFRLSRQHGFDISQDIFKIFKDFEGNFAENLSQDMKGILSLYEASYMGQEEEDILDEAKAFTRKHLMNVPKNVDPSLADLVNRALDLPLHLRTNRLEARWYIDNYSRNNILLELAKLDYNMVQGQYQNDIIKLSRWWEELGLSKKLPFARDRLVESFMWCVGLVPEPQYEYCREWLTKLIILITTIDDIYDIYATLDEAKLYTESVERWDVNAIEHLPEPLKLIFFALYDTVKEIANNNLQERGFDILPYLTEAWADLCKSYLLEAKWFHTEYEPTLKEYLDNACVSIAAPVVIIHVCILMYPKVAKETLDYLRSYPDLVRSLAMIFRLVDDMVTSKAEQERGDVSKSIQCYMNDKGVTEEVAREHIRQLICEGWKMMNSNMFTRTLLPQSFNNVVLNFARTVETTYQYGDGFSVVDHETKSRVLSLLVDPIPIKLVKNM